MTDTAITSPGVSWISRLKDSRVGPVSFMILVIMVIWYAGAVYLNAPRVIEQFERSKVQWTASHLIVF